jgi:hypothetical protein
MNKLLQAYITTPTDKARAKLQAYLDKHMMAFCFATPEEQQFIISKGFKV